MEIFATSRVNNSSLTFGNVHRKVDAAKRASCDSVSISDEARSLYQNSITNTINCIDNDRRSQVQAKLDRWFKSTHVGANIKINDDAPAIQFGEMLPENETIKKDIERQIDEIIKDANYAPPAVASPELIEKLLPLQQKLNAISALGDSMVMTNDILEQASSYLQGLENEWNKDKIKNNTITGQFRTALKMFGNFQSNIMKSDILEKIIDNN